MKTIDNVLDALKLNKSLEKLYKLLADLEIEGKAYSKEYMEYVDLVFECRKFIQRHINDIDLKDKELYDYTQNLSEIFRISDIDFIVQLITSNENNSSLRLINDLTYLAVDRGCAFVDEVDEHGNVIESIKDEDDFEDEDDYDDYLEDLEERKNELNEAEAMYNDQMYDIDMLNDKLLSNIMMDYVLDLIKKEENPERKKELIYFKYRLIYLFRYLESAFINDPKHITHTYVYMELLRFKLKDYEEILFDEDLIQASKNILEYEIEDVAQVNEKEIKTDIEKLKYQLRLIYIKTRLSMLYDKDTIEYFDRMKEEVKKLHKSEFIKDSIDESFKLKKELSLRNNLDL